MFIESPACRQCEKFCGATHLYFNTKRKLKCTVERLNNANVNSLLKKYLTDKTYHDLKRSKTTRGTTLLDCIQSGVENLDSSVGVYAPDAECYKTFALLFEPIIAELHDFQAKNKHPDDNWGPLKEVKNLDEGIIKTINITCKRDIQGYPFPPKLSREQYVEICENLKTKFKTIKKPPDLKGKFIPYESIKEGDRKTLENANAMIQPDSRFLEANEIYNYWPEGRALFMNNKKNFFIWFNEEDHFKCIAYNKGAKLKDTYTRLSNCVEALKKLFPFERNHRLGYLTVNPASLGTCLKFEIVAICPSLLQSRSLLDYIIKKYNLDIEIPKNQSVLETVIFKNKLMLGLTEFDIVMNIQSAMEEVATTEKEEKLRLMKLAKKK